jgi:amylosucrase
MLGDEELNIKAQTTKERLFPRLRDRFASEIEAHPIVWEQFFARLDAHFTRLFHLYYKLYSSHYDFYYHLEDLLSVLGRMWSERPEDLMELDKYREVNPLWFQSSSMLGGVCYVDLFAGNLKKLKQKLPYLKELGITYLHLMPLFKVPEGENDGGYAVSSYREVNPRLGTMRDLISLSKALRREGISLAVDLVFNHTSDDHFWAKQALAGNSNYQAYYWMFSDRKMPDAYEKNLREIFPEEHSGAFSFRQEIDMWIWTTFHTYQWDLNYSNPAVFNRIAEEVLFLANLGVEVLRLDAVAFIWKKLGTNCENLPEAHWIIQAFNAVARISAPALVFKSEAIVHPDEVVQYISNDECQLSYNPLIMALLWNTLATRETNLIDQALKNRFSIPSDCAWINYVRVHDDIGWTFSDEDAINLNINPLDHRRFLNDFYTGRFPGSFARGLPFQENITTGDARISGTCASLAGLESALLDGNTEEVELAIKRILLIHAIILTIGGIPLIYLGDEIGMLNDYSYRNDPSKQEDSRWVHRPKFDWEKAQKRSDPSSMENRIFYGLKELIDLRKQTPPFSSNELISILTENPHVLGYLKSMKNQRILVFANFSERNQRVTANQLRLYGLSYRFHDLLRNQFLDLQDLVLEPYGFYCLEAADNSL